MKLWPWSHRGDRSGPDLRVDVADERADEAEERVTELEQRADAAQEKLTSLAERLDPWVGSVLGTIHGGRGRHER